VTDNLLLKLVSVLAAILLAYSVNSERNTSVLTFSVPIEMKNPPEDKVLVKPSRRMAQVTLRGPSFLVGPIASSPPPLKVVIPDDVSDKFQASLKTSDLAVPSMIEVLSVEPAEVDFVFEPLERKEYKVEVPRVGQLKKPLTLTKVEINPKVVVIKGPRSELKQIRALETEPLNLDEVGESQTLTLAVRNPGNQSTLGSKSVSVEVSIDEVPRERILERRPVELRTSPNVTNVRIAPTEASVTIEGPPGVVSDVDPSEVQPFVRVREVPAKDGTSVEIKVDLPEGCALVKVEPRAVVVLPAGNGQVTSKQDKKSKGTR
jgi:YbbR domain-containing protein